MKCQAGRSRLTAPTFNEWAARAQLLYDAQQMPEHRIKLGLGTCSDLLNELPQGTGFAAQNSSQNQTVTHQPMRVVMGKDSKSLRLPVFRSSCCWRG